MMNKKLTKKELINDFKNWFYFKYLLAPFGTKPYEKIAIEVAKFLKELEKMDGRKKTLLIKTIEEKKESLDKVFFEIESRYRLASKFSRMIYGDNDNNEKESRTIFIGGSVYRDPDNNLGVKLPLVYQLLNQGRLSVETAKLPEEALNKRGIEFINRREYDLKVDEYAVLYNETIVIISSWCEECEPREIYFKYRFWDRLKFKRKSAWVRETDIFGYGKTLKDAKRVRKLLRKAKLNVKGGER